MNALKTCVANPNMAVPFLLMASYLYYIKHESSPLSDHEFDCLCEFARQNWNKIEHRHKHLIRRPWLAAGSLYKLRDSDYPLIVKAGAYSWRSAPAGVRCEVVVQLARIARALERFIVGEGLPV